MTAITVGRTSYLDLENDFKILVSEWFIAFGLLQHVIILFPSLESI